MNATACCHHYETVGFQINTILFLKSNHPPSNKILMVDRLPRCVFIKNLHLSLWNVSSLFCPTFNASFSKIIPFFVLHFVPKTTIRKVQRHRIWYLGAALHSLVGCRVIEAPLWDRYNNFFHSYSNPEIGFQDWMGRKSTFILILLANEIPIAFSGQSRNLGHLRKNGKMLRFQISFIAHREIRGKFAWDNTINVQWFDCFFKDLPGIQFN